MAINEMPPMLSGSVAQNIANLRAYLVRMVNELNDVATAASDGTAIAAAPSVQKAMTAASKDKTAEDIRKNAESLKSLIVKTANELAEKITSGDSSVMHYADERVDTLSSVYVAQSEFGTFQENIQAQITATARGVVESYDYDSAIESAQDDIEALRRYYTSIDGEIRRGIVQDPETGEYVTGIAISQNLQFSGECAPGDSNNPQDGYTYYYLSSGQTFGLYTSTGWQFWIDGVRRGYFNSEDGVLHISRVQAEESMQFGDSWLITSAGGFGMRKI